MFRYACLLWFFFAVMAVGLAQQTTTIKEAQVSFEFVDKQVKGTIGGFESTSTINPNDLEHSQWSGSVDVATLDTGIGLRNWHLKGGTYFDKAAYPRIFFKSTQVAFIDGQWVVDGLLTLKGVEKPWQIIFTQDGKVLLGTASLYTSDFGIAIKKERSANLVKVSFRFVLA
jgi:polyisoprenoid-binding protein YceI